MGTGLVSSVNTWISTVSDIRDGLIEAASGGNKLAASFAEAEARHTLLATITGGGPEVEYVRASLLKWTDPQINMVELANDPTPDDRIRICALALLNGFCPGEQQFAIFGGGRNRPASLYIKEAGFRTLFAHLAVVPEVSTEPPEWSKLGTGKFIWLVRGTASCTWHGKSYRVDFSKSPVGIPGYETDNISGISAKARRRMLQQLWNMVAPVFNADAVEDGTEIIHPAEPRVIEHARSEAIDWDVAYKLIMGRTTISDEHKSNVANHWSAIQAAETKDELRDVYAHAKAAGVKAFGGQRELDRVLAFASARAEGMTNE